MYCSCGEPSEVEHYRPVAVFPELAFSYDNLLWTCHICNATHKGQRFPPDTEAGERILNPLDDDVWSFFFLDDTHARLICRFDPVTNNLMARAVSTLAVVGIDCEDVQKRRAQRFKQLREAAEHALAAFHAGDLTRVQLRARIAEWKSQAFRPDVADYFLTGPGAEKAPFSTLVAAAT